MQSFKVNVSQEPLKVKAVQLQPPPLEMPGRQKQRLTTDWKKEAKEIKWSGPQTPATLYITFDENEVDYAKAWAKDIRTVCYFCHLVLTTKILNEVLHSPFNFTPQAKPVTKLHEDAFLNTFDRTKPFMVVSFIGGKTTEKYNSVKEYCFKNGIPHQAVEIPEYVKQS